MIGTLSAAAMIAVVNDEGEVFGYVLMVFVDEWDRCF